MSKNNNAEAVSDHQKGSFEVSSNNRPVTQPVPPPATGYPLAPQYYPQDHQAAPQGERLPEDIGIGWKLFIFGFLLGLAWYVGAIMLCCCKRDRREKPGLIACAIAAVVYTVLIVIFVSVKYQ